MEKIIWSKAFSVGVEEIDEQHRNLIDIINDLLDETLMGRDTEVVSDIISRMVAYIDYHFGTEEAYMTRFHFPGLVSHRDEHRFFILKVIELRKQHLQDKEGLSLDVLVFLMEWFRKHVTETDAAYKQCFLENGLR